MEILVNNKPHSVKYSGKAEGLLRHLGIPREEVVVKINGRLAPETTEIKQGDRVEIIKVVFGG